MWAARITGTGFKTAPVDGVTIEGIPRRDAVGMIDVDLDRMAELAPEAEGDSIGQEAELVPKGAVRQVGHLVRVEAGVLRVDFRDPGRKKIAVARVAMVETAVPRANRHLASMCVFRFCRIGSD